jgi:hypothetical protein
MVIVGKVIHQAKQINPNHTYSLLGSDERGHSRVLRPTNLPGQSLFFFCKLYCTHAHIHIRTLSPYEHTYAYATLLNHRQILEIDEVTTSSASRYYY